jgi:hypothetical protein
MTAPAPTPQTALSGRYEGEITAPTAGTHSLDLRVDIDPRYDNSPVMDRVSGDLFQVNRVVLPGQTPQVWRVYQESWVVEHPVLATPQPGVAEITGTAIFYKRLHPPRQMRLRLQRGPAGGAVTAQVDFLQDGAVTASFSCARRSDCFRELNLEVDVCRSVQNRPPLLPSFRTHDRSDRPPGLPDRTLTIEEAYREAGVLVSISRSPEVVDDQSTPVAAWSEAELHHAMEEHFTKYSNTWPRWDMWGLLATKFTNPLVGGIMFDTAAAFGGSGQPPERQGFAVFRDHEWFDALKDAVPTTPEEAEAARQFLYTWVHEAGHAFNFLHSWDKNRPNALSWMNYDWKYQSANQGQSFWANFAFRFDDEELSHLRHGDRAAVIMGGDPWASGGHIEAPPGAEHLLAPPGAMAQVEGEAPVELVVRSQGYFEFMEPVTLELRLRNKHPSAPLTVDERIGPEHGNAVVYIRRPDGRILEYTPITCRLALPRGRQLLPGAGASAPGLERASEEVFVFYGRYGFYFDQPGEYLVRATYQGAGGLLIPSDTHRLRVGHPATPDDDRRAQDYFSYEVGMSLYLEGSRSPYLKAGMELLTDFADRYKDRLLGARAALAVANSLARPFHLIEMAAPAPPSAPSRFAAAPERLRGASGPERVAKVAKLEPDTGRASQLLEGALGLFEAAAAPLNLTTNRVVRQLAGTLAEAGQADRIRPFVTGALDALRGRGVHVNVLQDIANALLPATPPEPAPVPRRRRGRSSPGRGATSAPRGG